MSHIHSKHVLNAIGNAHALYGPTCQEIMLSHFAIPATASVLAHLDNLGDTEYLYTHENLPYFVGKIIQYKTAPHGPVLLPTTDPCFVKDIYHDPHFQQQRVQALSSLMQVDMRHLSNLLDVPHWALALPQLTAEELLLSKIIYTQQTVKALLNDMAHDTSGTAFSLLQSLTSVPTTPVIQLQMHHSHYQWNLNLAHVDDAIIMQTTMMNAQSPYAWSQCLTFEGYC